MTILLLSPHRDDAAFSLGLSVQWWLAAGHTVRILNCLTLSEYAPQDLETHPKNVPALRQAEDEQWRRQYEGRLEFADLKLADAPLRLGCPVDEVCGWPVSRQDAALPALRLALQSAQADAFVFPLALGAHVDHATAREAAGAIDRNTPCAFYEDLPYAARPGSEQAIDSAIAAAVEGLGLSATFACAPAPADASLARKRTLVHCYRSQIDNATAEQIAAFCLRYAGRERLWVNDAWRASKQIPQYPGASMVAA